LLSQLTTSKITLRIAVVLATVAMGTFLTLPLATQASGAAEAARQAITHPRQQAAGTVPPGRKWTAFAYDPACNEFVLFGGDNNSVIFGDTWLFKDGIWIQQHPTRSPSARTGANMVYDAATHQLLLFGGSTGFESGFQADTWLWTGTTWRRLHPATSPPARHNTDMVYDAATHQVILFGGYDGSYLGDTWSWNGSTWTELTPATSPSPRDSDSMAYDQATKTAILFGGFSTSTGRLGDTWSWNGTTWTQLTPASSPGVVTTAWQAAYDAATQQVLLFGGDLGIGFQPQNQTWAWNGTTWTQLHPPTSPGSRAYGSMAYSCTTHRIVLFGGYTNIARSNFPSVTWRWNGTTWQRAS
jgi:hypothetical protein